jgi:hypothetical protein
VLALFLQELCADLLYDPPTPTDKLSLITIGENSPQLTLLEAMLMSCTNTVKLTTYKAEKSSPLNLNPNNWHPTSPARAQSM